MTPDIKALIKRLHEKTWESDRGEDDDPHTAADAVCVWHMTPSDGYEGSCDEDCMWFSAYEECPSCGKPIKFTEAKE